MIAFSLLNQTSFVVAVVIAIRWLISLPLLLQIDLFRIVISNEMNESMNIVFSRLYCCYNQYLVFFPLQNVLIGRPLFPLVQYNGSQLLWNTLGKLFLATYALKFAMEVEIEEEDRRGEGSETNGG